MKEHKLIFRYARRLSLTIGMASTLLLGGCAVLGGCDTQPLAPLPLGAENPPLAEVPPVNVDIQTIPVTPRAGEDNSQGGLIAADVNGDQQLDLLVSRVNFIAAYSLTAGELWKTAAPIHLSEKVEYEGLPGSQGPGMQAGDIDQDGQVEVLYLTAENSKAFTAST
jgi:hypothetical protein